MVSGLVLGLAFLCGCGGSGASGGGSTATVQTSAPAINTVTNSNLQNGAVLVTLSNTEAGAQLYYTVDGSTPTSASTPYEAPFLVASNLTVKAIAQNGTETASNVTSQTFSPGIASGTLVWSDEFANSTGANAQPNTAAWKYQTGADVNSSVDIHCAYGSSSSPCSTAYPNSFVGTDGYLHILAQQPSAGVYTAARMQTNGLFSFQYGRLEARIWVPEGQGIWPAFWLEGNNSATVGWPACGEMDVMERINAAGLPPSGTQSNPAVGTSDWNEGSIHGTGFTGGNLGGTYDFTGGATAAGWHTYGMIKKANSIAYYIDDPSKPYVTFTPSSIASLSGSVWPFDNGQSSYLILNIAVGGSWPGAPDSTTAFPAEMLVDYVRLYSN
jgi:beta-glucanase (GH16 family)